MVSASEDMIIDDDFDRCSKRMTASTSSTISTFDTEEYKRLNDILAAPEQLAFFQTFLQNIHAHENLLFIEALSQLRHEKTASNIELIVNRY
jgi:hypothetical protein